MTLVLAPIDDADRELIRAARNAVARIYSEPRHTVIAAIRGQSGRIHLGPNVWTGFLGPCAEPVAIGAAVLAGESQIATVVAVHGGRASYILPPCGRCRQMILDYAPEARVILEEGSNIGKVSISALLPVAYHSE